MIGVTRDDGAGESGCDSEPTVRTDDASRAEASTDYGGVVHALPAGVVTPRTSEEVAAIVARVAAHGQTVVIRGAGHSLGGQCLRLDAYVLSTSELCEIAPVDSARCCVTVGAGAHWSDVVNATIPLGLIPPVLTDNLQVSVGGTLSVGGIGPASFRSGLQLHNCEALEVALSDGETTWLSRDDNPRLFESVLGGLGHFGVITRARLKLRPCLPHVHWAQASYGSLDQFLDDAAALLRSDGPTYLWGSSYPSADSSGEPREFVLRIGVEWQTPLTRSLHRILGGLGYRERFTTTLPIGSFVHRHRRLFERARVPVSREARPWVESLLPMDRVKEYVERIAPCFPKTSLLLWPLSAKAIRWPSFATPSGDELMLVGILAQMEQRDLPDTLPKLKAASDLACSLGGKRYLSGWLDFAASDWRAHYGSYWDERQRLQNDSDPSNLLPRLPRDDDPGPRNATRN